MAEVRIALDWWPPGNGEPIGTDRAHQLVEALRVIIEPVVEEAEADLRLRAAPGTDLVRGGAPAHYVAGVLFGPKMESLCVATVYEVGTGDPDSNSIHLHRDGRLTWRRD